jgi:hypothetical protein
LNFKAVPASDGLLNRAGGRLLGALILAAEQAGNQILRRVDANPLAVLQIELIRAASRSSPTSPVSRLIGK